MQAEHEEHSLCIQQFHAMHTKCFNTRRWLSMPVWPVSCRTPPIPWLAFPSIQGRVPNLYVNEMHKSTEVSGRGCACRELNVGSAGSFLGIAFIFKQKFLYLQTTQFWICCKAPPQTKQNKEGPGGQESTKQLHHSFLQMQRVAIFETRNGFNYAAL